MNRSLLICVGLVCCMLCRVALAQNKAASSGVGGVYTCTDANGRRLTSDRPIPECMDREQKVLNASGTVKQIVRPPPTEQERAAQEARERKEREERLAIEEAKRRDKSLVVRFPNQSAHDKERAEALAQVAIATQAAQKRLQTLQAQRKKLDDEMEFYKKDPNKAPAPLRGQIEENMRSVEQQKGIIAEQDNEIKRINTRFDTELVRLRQLWSAPVSSAR